MKPTAITSPLPVLPSPVAGPMPITPVAPSLKTNGLLQNLSGVSTITLNPEQVVSAEKMLANLDFASMRQPDIALIGHDAEQALTETLDGFLARINRANNPALFGLFDRLQQGVSDAKLPDLLKEIKSGKLPMMNRLRALLSKDGASKAAQSAYEATCGLISGRTNTLSGVMQGLEKELQAAMQALLADLREFDALRNKYHSRISEFAVAAAVSQVLLQQARAYVQQRRAELAGNADPMLNAEIELLESKLQLLESRALAIEGVYSSLPADQMVIQQIELAGIQTLQETATTATARFSSIKTTLIALHGALQIKGVQRMNAQSAALDRQLNEVRSGLTKEVVHNAANAPGDNRLEQAQKLEQVIAFTEELQTLVRTARAANATKFDTAREIFSQARTKLSTLSNPKTV